MDSGQTSGRQFTLRTLLFAMLCVGGIIAGFQAGYRWGTERRLAEGMSTKLYLVDDLAPLDPPSKTRAFDSLIDVLQSTVDPASWDIVGGAGGIESKDDPPVLVVNQTGTNHKAVAELLSELRKLKEAMNVKRQSN